MDAMPNRPPNTATCLTPPRSLAGQVPAAEIRRWAEGLDLLASLCPSPPPSSPAAEVPHSTIESFDWGPPEPPNPAATGIGPSFGIGTAATGMERIRRFASRAILPLRPGDFDPTTAVNSPSLREVPENIEPRAGVPAARSTNAPAGWSDFLAALE